MQIKVGQSFCILGTATQCYGVAMTCGVVGHSVTASHHTKDDIDCPSGVANAKPITCNPSVETVSYR